MLSRAVTVAIGTTDPTDAEATQAFNGAVAWITQRAEGCVAITVLIAGRCAITDFRAIDLIISAICADYYSISAIFGTDFAELFAIVALELRF